MGDMWSVYDDADLFLLTTNSAITKDGALVMGRGIALEASQRFPGLSKAIGQQIVKTCGSLGTYGLLVSSRWPEAKLGAFQAKTNPKQSASLALIQKSTTALCAWCKEHPQASVHLNFPGTGHGGLLREKVLPIVEQLPETVCIWEQADSTPEPSLESPVTPPGIPAQPEQKRPKWMPDPRDAEAMAQSAQAFFALPEIPMNDVERPAHIFACAFYRGAGWMYRRILEQLPQGEEIDRSQKGLWVQGAAVFLPGIEDEAQAYQLYAQNLMAGKVAMQRGIYADALRLLLAQKQLEAAQQRETRNHEQP
jgi:hypothetical protein